MRNKITMLAAAIITFAANPAHAIKRADCGANLNEVKSVITRLYPKIGTQFTNAYIGTWVYSGYEPMRISETRPFRAMGYDLIICPRADRSFMVYWKEEKTFAGILKISGRNQVTIYQTSYGDIPLERAGSMTAGQ